MNPLLVTPVIQEAGTQRLDHQSSDTNELLASILHVLHKLDSRMDEQSKCIQTLSHILTNNSSERSNVSPSVPKDSIRLDDEDKKETLPHNGTPFSTEGGELFSEKPAVLIPPTIADTKQQRKQLSDVFQSSPFGAHYRKPPELRNITKKTKEFIKQSGGSEHLLADDEDVINIMVEDPEGNVIKVDYINDPDTYLNQTTLRENGGGTIDTRTGSLASLGQKRAILNPRTVQYIQFPPPAAWLPGMRRLLEERTLEETFTKVEMEQAGRLHLGTLWFAPPDGRVNFSFQRHHLNWLGRRRGLLHLVEVKNKLESLDATRKNIRWDPCLLIDDYGLGPGSSPIQYLRTINTIPRTQAEVNLLHHPATSSRAHDFMAPWKRVIQLKGFSSMEGLFEPSCTGDISYQAGPTFSLLFASVGRTSREYHDSFVRSLLEEAMRKHVSCARNSRLEVQMPKFLSIRYTSFHVTFFEMIETPQTQLINTWKTGKLYGVDQMHETEKACIRESACTIIIITDNIGDYWTALYMRPETFPRYIRSERYKDENAAIAADILVQAISDVSSKWKTLTMHLKSFIVDNHLLLDPEGHDSLLFDDDSFSMSRRYFWAINFLTECDSRITDNLQEFDKATSDWAAKLEPEGNWPEYGVAFSDSRAQLTEIQHQLRIKRAEAIALRDGLFSASSVRESRASTRLGENVKLLTFVSIFFLPLSFCTSLWSMNNEAFSFDALVGVIIAVALGTYLVVFNLNTIVEICTRIYSKQKEKIIEYMSVDEKWQNEGQKFKRFQPRQQYDKPSEWKIVVFLISRLFWWVGSKKKPIRNDGELQNEESQFGKPHTEV